MTETATLPIPIGMSLDDMPWQDPDVMPPKNLPDDDGEKMESPWHLGNMILLKMGYLAAQGDAPQNYYVGANMFLYYSTEQIRTQDFKGPDMFIVKNVDGSKNRNYWAIWDEGGRYPDVIFEFLSQRTERTDLGEKKRLYEQIFRTREYFCVAPEVKRLLGWQLNNGHYEAIEADSRGWLWSKELELWLAPWRGTFLQEEHTWLRFYHRDGGLVLLPEEAERQRAERERQRAEQERQRADSAEARLRAAKAEMEQLRQQLAALQTQD